jgi:hypothetical protein
MSEDEAIDALVARAITAEQALELMIAAGVDPQAAAYQIRSLEEVDVVGMD